jgi:hypothetical protein
MTLHFSAPVSPASSVSSYEHGHQQPRHSWLLTDLDAKHPWKPKPEPSGKHRSRSNDSGPSVGSVEVECRAKFKELNAENLKLLCGALEKEVPWQKEIVPEIASTVLQCRSGITKRRDKSRSTDAKEETWMLFLGGDAQGKEAVARELAGLVFGSRNHLLTIRLGAAAAFPSVSEDEEQRSNNKRPRTSSPAGGKLACLERLYEAVSENPHRVILVEDVDQADRDCELGIKEAIESGAVRNLTGDDVVGLGDAIVILSCENFEGSRSRACSPPPSKQMKLETMEDATEEQTSDRKPDEAGSSCFDLNINVETYQVDEVHVDDVCLLAAVDRTLFFKRHEGEHS